MRKVQRLAAISAMAVLVAVVSACSSSESPSTLAPAPEAAPPSSAASSSDGVTTASDTFGAACSQLPKGNAPGSLDSMGPMPVASAASTNPLLKTLVSTVKAANLVDVLNSQKAITVFAPYDPAFDAVKKSIGDAKFSALLANKDALGNILKYHVIARRYDKAGLLAEPSGSIATLAGGSLQIKSDGDTLTVTDGAGTTAHVLCGNIPTKNATVFVIDKVLMGQKS